MTRFARAIAIFVATTALTAAQASLAGRWQGETANGTPIVLDLTVNGSTLAGTLIRGDQPVPIFDGKVSGNGFTFKATINGRTDGFSGELAGDQLRIWLDRQGAASAVLLARVKSA